MIKRFFISLILISSLAGMADPVQDSIQSILNSNQSDSLILLRLASKGRGLKYEPKSALEVISVLKMLSEKKIYTSDREDVSIIPLAFPLTAGIGTITTVILLFSESNTLLEAAFVFIAIIIGVIVSYFGMIYSPKLFKVLGHDGLHVMSTLMAIIVLAIAVQFIINGIIAVIPFLPID